VPSNPLDEEYLAAGSSAGNPLDSGYKKIGGNPLNTGYHQVSQKHGYSGIPLVRRSESENPILWGLQAGSRLGKHLVATGKFGIPDQAGEDQDRQTIMNRLDDFVNPTHAKGKNNALQQRLAPVMEPIEQSAAGFGIDTALDPTTYLGGILARGVGAGVKAGVRAGAPLLKAGLERSPKMVQDAAAFAKEGLDKIGDQFHWGGDARRKLTPEQYRDAGLALNRQGARQSELARRLEVRRAGIFDHLNDQQRLSAYRLLNGEVDVVADPAVNKAVAQGRKLLRDAGYIQANKGGRARLSVGSSRSGNANLTKPQSLKPGAVSGEYIPPEGGESRILFGEEADQALRNAEDSAKGAFGKKTKKPEPVPESSVNKFSGKRVKAGIEKAPELDEFESMVPDDVSQVTNRTRPKLKLKGAALPEYQLPDDLKEFAAPADQGILGARNIREDYLPGVRAAQTVAEHNPERPREFNLLNPFAGHALERESFQIGDKIPEGQTIKDVVGPYDDALKRYMKASATQATAGLLRHELGLKPGEAQGALAKLFDVKPRAQGDARNLTEQAQDYLRLPADMARSALTAFGLKHGSINVPTLAGLSEGVRPVGAMFRDAGRLMRMSPEEKYEFNREAREAGVLGPEYDHDNQTLGLLDKVPALARAGFGGAYGAYQGQKTEADANPNAGLLQRGGAGLLGGVLGAGAGAAAPAIGRFSNDLTWNLDEAAKRAVFNNKVRRGMSPAEAAAQTLHDTVDYTKRTPIAQGLQDWGLAPFATFATKIPGAVAGSVARDPRKAILMDRLSQGLLSNGKVDLPGAPPDSQGNPGSFNMSTPLSEAIEFGADPVRYSRAKMSDPARAIISALTSAATHGAKGSHYMTYGQPLLPHKKQDGIKAGYLLNSAAGDIPFGGGRAVLDALDADEFSPESLASAILGPLVGGYVK